MATTVTREQFDAGLSAVYHARCVVYHFRYEVDENKDLTSRVPRARIQTL